MAFGLTLLLLGAVLLALRLLRGRPEDAALGMLLGVPLMLYMGSFSLVLGTACGFAALAGAARCLLDGRARFAVLFLVGTILGCIANIQVAVPVLAATLGGVAGSLLWRRLRGGRLALARPEAMLLAAAAPVVGLVLLYRAGMADGALSGGAQWRLRRQLAALLFRGDAAWFWFSDLALFLLLNLALVAAAAWWLWRGAGRGGAAPAGAGAGDAAADAATRVAPWALAGALAVAGAMLVLPVETLTAPQIPMRLGPFLQFLLFLWFLAAGLPLWWRRAILGLALAAGLSQMVTRAVAHRELDGRIAEMTAMEALIPAGSVIDVLRVGWIAAHPTAPHDTPAHYLGGFRLRFSPFIHAGRGIAGRDIVDLGNYQLLPHWRIFRLRPKPALEAVQGLGQLDWRLHEQGVQDGLAGHLRQVLAATGHGVDYLLVWTSGLDAAARAQADPVLAAVLDDLRAGFEPVARSAPRGYAELWRRKAEGGAPH